MKLKDKIKLIPKGYYCYDYINGSYKQCPFMSYRRTNFGFRKFRKRDEQFCKYLHKYLDVGDDLKDCGLKKYYEDCNIG